MKNTKLLAHCRRCDEDREFIYADEWKVNDKDWGDLYICSFCGDSRVFTMETYNEQQLQNTIDRMREAYKYNDSMRNL